MICELSRTPRDQRLARNGELCAEPGPLLVDPAAALSRNVTSPPPKRGSYQRTWLERISDACPVSVT